MTEDLPASRSGRSIRRATSQERVARICHVLGLARTDLARPTDLSAQLSDSIWHLVDEIDDDDMRERFAEAFSRSRTPR